MIYQKGRKVFTKRNQEGVIHSHVIKEDTGELTHYKVLTKSGKLIKESVDEVYDKPVPGVNQRSEEKFDDPWEGSSLSFQGERVIIIGIYYTHPELLTIPLATQYKVMFPDGATAYVAPAKLKVDIQ